MKANIRQHLAFHIHVLVVSLCELGIVLFHSVISVSLRRLCPSPSFVCRVVSVSLLISASVTLRVRIASDLIVSVPSYKAPLSPDDCLFNTT